MARIRDALRRYRSILVLAACGGLAQAPLLLGAGAAPAQAVTCGTGYYYYWQGAVSSVSFNWYPECSDGTAHITSGTVYDTSCDSRTAEVEFQIFDKASNGSYNSISLSPWYKASGCGTSATFPTWVGNSPGSSGWELMAHLRACSTTCSSESKPNAFG